MKALYLALPVIATRVGGIPEFVNHKNGKLIGAGDEKALEKLLNAYLDKKLKFENTKIQSESKDVFSPDQIGRELNELYLSILNS